MATEDIIRAFQDEVPDDYVSQIDGVDRVTSFAFHFMASVIMDIMESIPVDAVPNGLTTSDGRFAVTVTRGDSRSFVSMYMEKVQRIEELERMLKEDDNGY